MKKKTIKSLKNTFKSDVRPIPFNSGVEVINEVKNKIPKFGSSDYAEENVANRLTWLENVTHKKYPYLNGKRVASEKWKGNIENLIGTVQVPIGIVGPVPIQGQYAKGDFIVPLATTEGAIVTTYNIGMRLLRENGGVTTTVKDNGAHITPMFDVKNMKDYVRLQTWIDDNFERIKTEAESTTQHGKLLSIESKYFDSKLCATFQYSTGDAQGLNMINVATEHACKFIQKEMGYVFQARSNYSGVKKISDHNAIPTFGKEVFAEAFVSANSLVKMKTTPELIESTWHSGLSINTKSNIKGINCQAANAISAIFLACGQDIADISSSHIAYTSYRKTENNMLHIEVYIPSLTIGTVGGGTGVGVQKECLEILDCYGKGGVNKFAEIIAATVLAGELTTICAITTGTFVSAHAKLGRNKPEMF